MLRTIAYAIFICTGVFAFFLIMLFVRSQSNSGTSAMSNVGNTIPSVASNGSIMQRLEQNYSFRKSTQKDIFGAFIFDFPVQIMVADRLRVYVFENDYSLIRRNLLLLSAIYEFQDTTDFYGKTFFLNDKVGDGSIVRFLVEIDGRAYGFEVFRDEYISLKSLLLK